LRFLAHAGVPFQKTAVMKRLPLVAIKTQSICHNPTRKSDGFFLDKTAEEKMILSQTRYG
jgi:hypothetical protein